MTQNYKIAKIILSIDTQIEYFHDLLKDYLTSDKNVEMSVKIIAKDVISPSDNLTIDRQDVKVKCENGITTAYYFSENICYGAISYDDKYVNVEISLCNKPKIASLTREDVGYLLLGTLFHYRLTYFDGISLHGSAIKFDNSAIIFTAPSGVGKSTQANLWREKFGSRVSFINDDKPALRFDESGQMVCYGSPFSGKNHINVNDSAPLKAIVNVVRGKTNCITRLSNRESIVLLLEETTRASLCKDINVNNMRIISKILQCVPVFRLSCTPTEEAVDVAYDLICEVL